MDGALLLFAFTAGAVAFFAPCCVGMLPAYIAYAVRPPAAQDSMRQHGRAAPMVALGMIPFSLGAAPLFARSLGAFGLLPIGAYRFIPPLEASIMLLILGAAIVLNAFVWTGRSNIATRGLVFGLLATLGVLLGFLLVGAPVALLATLVTPYLVYVSVIVAAIILALGLFTLAGGTIAPRLPTILPDVTRPSGFLKFGFAYAVAGLTCTFPAFLAVMAAATTTGGFAAALETFVAYALGKASVLVGVTAVIVAGGEGLAPKLAKHARLIERGSAIMLILVGAFMLYYFGRPLVFPELTP